MNTHLKIARLLTVLMLVFVAAKAKTGPFDPAPEADKVIEMKGTDNLKYSKNQIRAKPGQTITIKLTTESNHPKSAMAHNIVLLSKGADAQQIASKCAQAYKNDYIAPSTKDQIIAYSGLAGDGETVSLTFTVPEENGAYEYICTFPGHFASGMKGILIVTG